MYVYHERRQGNAEMNEDHVVLALEQRTRLVEVIEEELSSSGGGPFYRPYVSAGAFPEASTSTVSFPGINRSLRLGQL